MTLNQSQQEMLRFLADIEQREGPPSVFVTRVGDRLHLRVDTSGEIRTFASSAYDQLIGSDYIGERVLPRGQGKVAYITPLGYRVIESDFERLDNSSGS